MSFSCLIFPIKMYQILKFLKIYICTCVGGWYVCDYKHLKSPEVDDRACGAGIAYGGGLPEVSAGN